MKRLKAEFLALSAKIDEVRMNEETVDSFLELLQEFFTPRAIDTFSANDVRVLLCAFLADGEGEGGFKEACDKLMSHVHFSNAARSLPDTAAGAEPLPDNVVRLFR